MDAARSWHHRQRITQLLLRQQKVVPVEEFVVYTRVTIEPEDLRGCVLARYLIVLAITMISLWSALVTAWTISLPLHHLIDHVEPERPGHGRLAELDLLCGSH